MILFLSIKTYIVQSLRGVGVSWQRALVVAVPEVRYFILQMVNRQTALEGANENAGH